MPLLIFKQAKRLKKKKKKSSRTASKPQRESTNRKRDARAIRKHQTPSPQTLTRPKKSTERRDKAEQNERQTQQEDWPPLWTPCRRRRTQWRRGGPRRSAGSSPWTSRPWRPAIESENSGNSTRCLCAADSIQTSPSCRTLSHPSASSVL